MLKHIVLGLVAAVAAFAFSNPPAEARPLAEIQKSGVLRVGVNPTLPPLGIYNDKNEIATASSTRSGRSCSASGCSIQWA